MFEQFMNKQTLMPIVVVIVIIFIIFFIKNNKRVSGFNLKSEIKNLEKRQMSNFNKIRR